MSKEKPHIPFDYLRVAGKLSRESEMPLDDILSSTHKGMEKAYEKRRAPRGKFRVLGIDKFEGTDWVHDDYDSEEETLFEARRLTEEGKKGGLRSWFGNCFPCL